MTKLMHNLDHGESSQNFYPTIVIFERTPKRNKSPNRRKFAQSGHTARKEAKIILLIYRFFQIML
jgi:hypothetical protein